MRSLTINEANVVSGADYSSDIVTAAATIYVGTTIGRFAAAFTHAGFTTAASLSAGIAPLSLALTTTGQILAPVMFFCAPIAVFNAIYPGVIEEKLTQYINN